jgi:hypothetical protein
MGDPPCPILIVGKYTKLMNRAHDGRWLLNGSQGCASVEIRT